MATLALLGGKRACTLPPSKQGHPNYPKSAIRKIVAQLEQRKAGIQPNELAEERLRDYHGGGYPLPVSSGTTALQLALMALGVGPGDDVITSPYSWGATTACILHIGAIPRFTDVDRETGLMDPATIEPLITRKTKAVLPVHIYGQAAPMTAICRVARKHGLAVIEDGSQAHGALWKGKKVGLFGDAGAFSCMSGKLLATTEAGYVIYRKKEPYYLSLMLSQHLGRRSTPGFPKEFLPHFDSLFYNFRVCALAATLLAEQITKLDREVDGRRENVRLLREALAGNRFLRFPNYPKGCEPSYHMLTANVDFEAAGVSRATYTKALAAEGMPHLQPYVPAPIPEWPRMNWQGYAGPPAPWLAWLEAAKVDYRGLEFPNCQWKIDHEGQMGFNYIRREPRRMKAFADCVCKVEEHIDDLRAWELSREEKDEG